MTLSTWFSTPASIAQTASGGAGSMDQIPSETRPPEGLDGDPRFQGQVIPPNRAAPFVQLRCIGRSQRFDHFGRVERVPEVDVRKAGLGSRYLLKCFSMACRDPELRCEGFKPKLPPTGGRGAGDLGSCLQMILSHLAPDGGKLGMAWNSGPPTRSPWD